MSRHRIAKSLGHPKETHLYKKALGQLTHRDTYLVVGNQTLTITALGLANAEAEQPIGSNQELLGKAKEQVDGKSKLILDELFDGKTKSRVKIGQAIGADAAEKSFGTLVSPLKKCKFIECVDGEDGEPSLRMTDALFAIDGRPEANPNNAAEDVGAAEDSGADAGNNAAGGDGGDDEQVPRAV